jgi:hypothetical protein
MQFVTLYPAKLYNLLILFNIYHPLKIKNIKRGGFYIFFNLMISKFNEALNDIYEEGGCCFFFVYAAIFFILSVGSIGQAVWLYIWWQSIRFDFSCRKDGNDNAFALYISVTTGWIFGLIFWGFSVIAILMQYLTTKFCQKPGKATEFIRNSSFLACLGFICSCIAVFVLTTDKKCAEMYQKGLAYGNQTKEFIEWYKKETEGVKAEDIPSFNISLNKKRCNDGATYTWIFFGVFVLGIIMLVVSIPFNKYVLEVDIKQLLISEED